MSRYETRIFVIGAKGNIGSNVFNFFLSKGFSTVGVCRKPEGKCIGYEQFLESISTSKASVIINAAYLEQNRLKDLLRVNAKKHNIIHISSVSVYGNTSKGHITAPINKYGRHKLEEEKIFMANSNVVILRLANIYGGIPETSGIEILYNKGLLRHIEVDTDGVEFVRDFIRCEYFMNVLLDVAENFKPHIRNVSSGKGLKISEHLTMTGKDVSTLPRVKAVDDSIIKYSVIDPDFYKRI